MCWCSVFSLDIWNYIKIKNVDKNFRVVTAMHCNGPLRQVCSLWLALSQYVLYFCVYSIKSEALEHSRT